MPRRSRSWGFMPTCEVVAGRVMSVSVPLRASEVVERFAYPFHQVRAAHHRAGDQVRVAAESAVEDIARKLA